MIRRTREMPNWSSMIDRIIKPRESRLNEFYNPLLEKAGFEIQRNEKIRGSGRFIDYQALLRFLEEHLFQKFLLI